MLMEFEREPAYFVGEIIDYIKNYEDGGYKEVKTWHRQLG
jgi:hypothetical protein